MPDINVVKRITEGIARLENILENVKCGGGVIVNAKHTSAVRRKYLGRRQDMPRPSYDC
jgi:hypothetical protein